MISYFTHDNGGRPFRVDVESDNTVRVFVIDQVATRNVAGHRTTPLYQPEPKLVWNNVVRVWVGKSPYTPTTAFSGGHGKAFDGNSLLIQLPEHVYVYIGSRIYQFKPLSPIVKYVSEVGNNDVPYPYAVDRKNNYYLMIENVILTRTPRHVPDVYDYYYDRSKMTPPPMSNQQQRQNWTRTEFLEFYVGSEQYHLTYKVHSASAFYSLRQEDSGPQDLFVVTRRSYPRRIRLTRQRYIAIMKAYGRKCGFRLLRSRCLVQRQ